MLPCAQVWPEHRVYSSLAVYRRSDLPFLPITVSEKSNEKENGLIFASLSPNIKTEEKKLHMLKTHFS